MSSNAIQRQLTAVRNDKKQIGYYAAYERRNAVRWWNFWSKNRSETI